MLDIFSFFFFLNSQVRKAETEDLAGITVFPIGFFPPSLNIDTLTAGSNLGVH